MSYFSDTKKGMIWIGAYRASTRIFSVVRMAILARLLSPEQFGIYGIAVLVLAFLEIFTETGVNTVLIQTKGKINQYINTAWIVSIFRGCFISIFLFLAAPLISDFFNTNEAINILRFTSLIPLIRGFINPSVVLFQKNLLFRTEFLYRTSLFFIDASVAVIAAFILRSPYALIYGLLAGALVELLISHLFVYPSPKVEFNRSRLSSILNKGKWLTLSGIFDYLFQNGDNLIVGRVLGSGPLGIYQSSYQVATQPVTEVGNIMSKVTFPVFVKISSDKERLYNAYLKTMYSTLLVVSPVALIFVLFPELIVNLIFGEKWLDAVPVLQVLGVLGIAKPLILTSYSYLLASNRQQYITAISAVGACTMLFSIVLLIKSFGLIGAAYAAVLGSFISLIPVYYFVNISRKINATNN